MSCDIFCDPGRGMSRATPQKDADELKRSAITAHKLVKDQHERALKHFYQYKDELEQSKELFQSLVPVWELCEKQIQVQSGHWSDELTCF